MAAVCQLKIKYDKDKLGVVSFRRKTPGKQDKHVVNEHNVVRKSHDVAQKKCPHVVHFNVPRDWFETNSRHQKRYSEGGKNIRGCRGLLRTVI